MKQTVADFFAGIGLVSLALERQRWSVQHALDYSEEKRAMYEGHFGVGHYRVMNILDVSADMTHS